MSDERTTPDPDPGASNGATTAVEGTPFAVDLSGDREGRTRLAVLLLGPVLWLTHFMVVYLVAEAGCTGDGPGLEVFDPPVPQALTLVATAVASVACLAAAGWAGRRWRARPSSSRTAGADRAGAPADLPVDRAMAFAGMLLSLLSFVAVLLVGLPALYLGPC